MSDEDRAVRGRHLQAEDMKGPAGLGEVPVRRGTAHSALHPAPMAV